jgi:hypothetical protein
MTTKKQWVTAISELTGETLDHKKFKTVDKAQEAFEKEAREAGLSWDVSEDGAITFSDGETEPENIVEQGATHPGGDVQFGTNIGEESAESSEDPPAPPTEQTEQAELPKMGERGRPVREADQDVIELLATSNPKRVGTATWKRFSIYRSGMTVAEFLAAGGRRVDLPWDSKHQFIRILPPGSVVQHADAGAVAPADADAGAVAPADADAGAVAPADADAE